MAEIRWTTQAIDDIANIADYIAKDSIRYATMQVELFFQSASILESFPKAGKIVPETRKRNIRELPVGSYRLIYRIKSPVLIEIITVYHNRRRLRPGILPRQK